MQKRLGMNFHSDEEEDEAKWEYCLMITCWMDEMDGRFVVLEFLCFLSGSLVYQSVYRNLTSKRWEEAVYIWCYQHEQPPRCAFPYLYSPPRTTRLRKDSIPTPILNLGL